MCIVSMVHDHYNPLIPEPLTLPLVPVAPYSPPATSVDLAVILIQMDEIKKLVQAFREDVRKAEELDASMKQPDCVDPEKAKLIDRVKQLEERIEALEKWRRG